MIFKNLAGKEVDALIEVDGKLVPNPEARRIFVTDTTELYNASDDRVVKLVSKHLAYYDIVSDIIGERLPIGGSIALMVHGAIPYREVKDIDIVYMEEPKGLESLPDEGSVPNSKLIRGIVDVDLLKGAWTQLTPLTWNDKTYSFVMVEDIIAARETYAESYKWHNETKWMKMHRHRPTMYNGSFIALDRKVYDRQVETIQHEAYLLQGQYKALCAKMPLVTKIINNLTADLSF